jgi:DNA-directed RNA polymerase subunit RPC12/RpoP
MGGVTAAPATPGASYRCPSCGGHGRWHPGRQAVACHSCGTTIDAGPAPANAVERFAFMPLLRDRPDSGRDWLPGATRVRCTACGAAMDYPAYLAGRNCEACSSPALVASDATGAPVHPSGVVPFAVTDGEARDHLVAWIATKRPFGRARGVVVEAVRAVYVPCWAFSARVRVPWRALWQKKEHDGSVKAVPIDGVEELTFDDEVAPASTSVPADALRDLEPVPAEDLRPYDPRYLAGYEVELYAVNLWDAWDSVDRHLQRRVDEAVRFSAGRNATDVETWPEWRDQRCCHVLVPVHAVRYAFRGKPYQAFVHGRSGAVAGRHPDDPVALLIGALILLGFAAAIVLLAILAVRWLF